MSLPLYYKIIRLFQTAHLYFKYPLLYSDHFLVLRYNFSSQQELQKERNSVTVQLDQSSRRLTQLEEEKKSADQSLKRTQGLVDDLKGNAEEMAAAILSFHSIVSFTA